MTLIVLRLNIDSVYAISILFGFVAIGAGINEFLAIAVSTRGWKSVHGILGVIFIAAGIVAFFRPAGNLRGARVDRGVGAPLQGHLRHHRSP